MANHSPGPWILTELPFDECGQQEPDFRIEAASTLFLTVSPCADGFVFGQNEANARLIAAAPDMVELIKGYEAWEADLILSDEAWNGGTAEFPCLTEELWDRLLELQAMRNAVSKKIVGTHAPTQSDRLAALVRHPSNSPFAMQKS